MAFKKFRDEWDFTFTSFPFEEWVPAEVLVQVVLLAKPPTSMPQQNLSPELNPNPGPVVPANSEDPWPLSDVDNVVPANIEEPWPLSDVDNERRVSCPRA